MLILRRLGEGEAQLFARDSLVRILGAPARRIDVMTAPVISVSPENSALEALALIGLGIHRLSITPASVGPIKELACKINAADISMAMRGWLANPPENLRTEIAAWAAERGIECD